MLHSSRGHGSAIAREHSLQHLARTVSADPDGEWIFLVDCLNTHVSESLVQWVAEQCGLPDELGKKVLAAF